MSSVHIIVADGFADWEPGYALAEVRRSGGLSVTTVGFTTAPVTSMGGLRVLPDMALTDVQPGDARLFMLPGGDLWEDETAYPRAELERVLSRLRESGIPIAAICGATVAVARAGLLDDRRHTSNAKDYLIDKAREYRGAALYEPELAVRDRGMITASGLGPVEFAREIFAELEVFTPSDAALWFDMFKHGRMPPALA
jgi:putative intracellular protease/amidase